MAQLTLSTKYVTVEVCNPPASARGNIEITDSGLDVRRDSVPIKLRIFIDDVCWRLIAELLVQTNFFKFVVERIGFSQIVGIAKLTDEICGSKEGPPFINALLLRGARINLEPRQPDRPRDSSALRFL